MSLSDDEAKELFEKIERLSTGSGAHASGEELEELRRRVRELEERLEAEGARGPYSRLSDARPPSAWDKVKLARHEDRPYTLDYIERLFSGFDEIHGDRKFRDDPAMVCGMAFLDEIPVMIVGQQKGRNMKQRLHRNYGMPKPEGYRKAIRVMKLAEKFKRSIITLIDTPGAYPGIGAEERGQAEAIAYSLREMAALRVPILSVVLGEGGSGGALAIGVADRVLMLENSIYSVISPESCSAILWKDQHHAAQAAENLKIIPEHLKEFGLIDEIVPEPPGGAHTDHNAAAQLLGGAIRRNLKEIAAEPIEQLLEKRYQKFRRMGVVTEGD